MLWLLQFLFGAFLAYYSISPRLRGFINHLIMRLFRRVKPFVGASYPKVKFRYVLEDNKEAEEIGEPLELETEPIKLGAKHGIFVGEEKIQEWLRANPDLVKVNKVKELVE